MKPNKGMLWQVLDGSSKLMQRLTNHLGSGFQLGTARRSLLVVP
jgi:hypothetical protein